VGPPMQSDQNESSGEILIRHPARSISSDIPRHWKGGDAFATHFLNALSSTFPFGEAFFVRSVLHYRKQISDPTLLRQIRGFAGQEGQHSRLHDEHVEMLLAQGYTALETRNRLGDRITRWHNRRMPKLSLRVTAALEHLTALLARQILSDPERRTADMHPEMAVLWRWHALEEAEHKAVAFDVLTQVAPSHSGRVIAMILNTFGLSIEVLDRTAYMLWKDGLLFKAKTWSSGLRFLFGEGGFLRGLGADYSAWYHRDFHPNDIDDRPLIEKNAPSINADIAA
jgi:predicted metal-dependent hydrolase